MGRLSGLELTNFKSYRGHAVIALGTSTFTSIVGPNGAGKSNMMDAISFVLGVQSHHLRSTNLRDLVYRGRVSEEYSADDDPTSASVVAHYERDDGTSMKLERRIVGSLSEYQIDGEVVSATEYTETLSRENILVKARNFLVFQGDVEHVASQSPKELGHWLEIVSGSGDYREEYDRLKEELEEASELSASAFTRKRVLNNESRQYREQMEEQHQFEKFLASKQEAKTNLFLYKLFHNEQRHWKLEESREQELARTREQKAEVSSAEKKYKQAASEYSSLVLATTDRLESLKEKRQQLETVQRERVPLEAHKKSLVKKLKSTNAKLVEIDIEAARQTKQVKEVSRRLKEAERLYRNFEQQSAQMLDVPSQAIDYYDKLRQKFLQNGGAELEQRSVLLENDELLLKKRLTTVERRRNQLGERQDELEQQMSSLASLNDAKAKITEILAQKKEKVEARNALVAAKEASGLEELKLQHELHDTLLKLEDVTSAQRESERHRKLLENIALLKRLFPGDIKGLVADLIKPASRKWEVALATVIGSSATAVVVQSASTAYKCVSLLKERRLGTMTFIPLDSLVVEPVRVNHWRHDPVATPAMDICVYDNPKLESVVNYLMGDTLVVNAVADAQHLKWSSSDGVISNKIVTADGAVINSSGYMTGGAIAKSAAASRLWDASEITALTEKKETLTAQLKQVSTERPQEFQLSQLADEITALDDQLPPLRHRKAAAERQVADWKTEHEHNQSQLDALKEDEAEYNQELVAIEEKINSVMQELKGIQTEIYGGFCDQYGFDSIEEYESTTGATLRGRSKEKSGFVRATGALSNQLQFETERMQDLDERKEKLILQRGQHEQDLGECQTKLEDIESKIDLLSAELEVVQDEDSSATKIQQKRLKSSKSAESELRQKQEELAAIETSIAEIDDEIIGVDAQRVTILKNAKLENVHIPLTDGVIEDQFAEDASLDEMVAVAYNLDIDYEDLGAKYRENEYSAKYEGELQAKYEEIIESLEKLTPNSRARDRLQEVEIKLQNFQADHAQTRQKERKVRQRFEKVKAQRTSRFMEAFDAVSGVIDSIYKELTDVDGVGGQAYLTLENEEEPFVSGIRYFAMPPMKRFKDMELLSGGEKTMAALALVFAIHSWKPAPFFVMDEIDAALDNANVARIARYISSHASDTFQFIVISLKPQFYDKSEALVGIYREQARHSSKTVTMDLREYPIEAS